MNSRADKYANSGQEIGLRTARNTDLYKEINKTELENFEVKSNATVIGDNRGNQIDVEKIKSILDTHYNDVPARRSIRIENREVREETKPIFETKEYDINVILDKAKEEKTENYEEERAKKLRDTQFDILSNLNIDPKDYIEDYDGDSDTSVSHQTSSAQELQELINTITFNENSDVKKPTPIKNNNVIKEENSTDPLDIFEDLRGDGTTAVLEGLQEKTQQLIQKMEETSSLDNSFFTKSNNFKKSDFEDFEELSDSKNNPIMKIIILILLIVFIVGVVILVKSLI